MLLLETSFNCQSEIFQSEEWEWHKGSDENSETGSVVYIYKSIRKLQRTVSSAVIRLPKDGLEDASVQRQDFYAQYSVLVKDIVTEDSFNDFETTEAMRSCYFHVT